MVEPRMVFMENNLKLMSYVPEKSRLIEAEEDFVWALNEDQQDYLLPSEEDIDFLTSCLF